MAPALVLAGGAAAAGGIMSAIAARNKSKFQAALSRQNATQQRAAGDLEARRQQRETDRRLGAISAAVGASGATLQGSPLLVLADEASVAEENRLLILAGSENRARRSLAQADALSRQGTAQLVGGILGAGSTLLTAGAKSNALNAEMQA